MKAIVVGAKGYIGKQLYAHAPAHFETYGTLSSPPDKANGLLRLRLDAPELFDFDVIRQSDIIFLTAAISGPDDCSREYGRAWAVNVKGTSEFIERATDRGGRVIFFSSDTVYGEKETEFDERAACYPVGEYAKMKHEVEKRFSGCSLFKSIRLSHVFSREDKFTKYLSNCAQRAEEAEVFHPFYRAVIHRDDVLRGVMALARRWSEFPQEVLNFGGPDVLARTEFAQTLKKVALPTLRFHTKTPEGTFFEKRPSIICMESANLISLLGRPARSLHDAASIEFGVKSTSAND